MFVGLIIACLVLGVSGKCVFLFPICVKIVLQFGQRTKQNYDMCHTKVKCILLLICVTQYVQVRANLRVTFL